MRLVKERLSAAAVIRTTIRSGKHPRTAGLRPDRSPPASWITGADSPVIADSSHRSDSLNDLAVARNYLACTINDRYNIAGLEVGMARHSSIESLLIRRWAARRIRRRVPAVNDFGLRPSARFGQAGPVAKLANKTVRNSQTSSAMAQVIGTRLAECPNAAWITNSRVKTAPSSTTNITGVFPLGYPDAASQRPA